MSSTKAPAMKQRLNKKVNQNRRVPAWVMLRTNRQFLRHPKRRSWRMSKLVIPLRATKQAPRTRRAKRAVKEVREIVMRHMKVDAEHVWIDASVNEKLWENGIRNPPSKITVKAVKFDDGLVEVSLAE